MTLRLRAGFAWCLALAVVLLDFSPANGQLNIGRPGGFMGGRPGGIIGGPGFPGGPGMPGGGAIGGPGMPGGGGVIGGPGMPGGGVIGGRPGIPGGGAIGGAIGGRPGMGGQNTVWVCPRCGRVVGRGALPPGVASCCGQTYVNGRATRGGFGGAPGPHGPGMPGPGGPAGPAGPAPTPPGGADPDQGGFDLAPRDPDPDFKPDPQDPAAPADNPKKSDKDQPAAPAPSTSSTQSSGNGMLVALGVGVILFGLLLLGGVVFLVIKSQKRAPVRKRRRARREPASYG